MTSLKFRAALFVACAVFLGSTAASAAALTTTTVARVPFRLTAADRPRSLATS